MRYEHKKTVTVYASAEHEQVVGRFERKFHLLNEEELEGPMTTSIARKNYLGAYFVPEPGVLLSAAVLRELAENLDHFSLRDAWDVPMQTKDLTIKAGA
jgi:hypothetical protein